MLKFSNCKINIGLEIKSKRQDGYHNIETVFYPIPWYDAVEIVPSDTVSITLSGIQIPGATHDNLCIKAYHLLKQDFPWLPPVQIFLHKTIPAGAGLGGGSANAACTLLMLNEMFSCKLPKEALMAYALELGSDCPLFIENKPCFGSGRGEILHPIDITLPGNSLLLVNPNIHIPTSWAFSQIVPSLQDASLLEKINQPKEKWQQTITNAFEAPVSEKFPEVKSLLNTLKTEGAWFVGMSGSGSTCFGIFDKKEIPTKLKQSQWPNNYLIHSISL